MKRYEMIKDKERFNHIIRNSKFVKDKNFVIYYIYNEENTYTHFGIAIKKSIGKAHIRNRLKRQTRALIDNHKKEFKKTNDYIIMIRDGCLVSDFNTMDKSLENLLRKVTYEK